MTEVETKPEAKDAPTTQASPDLRWYNGHEVELVGQSNPDMPEWNPGADPTHQALIIDWRGRHHTVDVDQLVPPEPPYPPPPPPEGASGASGVEMVKSDEKSKETEEVSTGT